MLQNRIFDCRRNEEKKTQHLRVENSTELAILINGERYGLLGRYGLLPINSNEKCARNNKKTFIESVYVPMEKLNVYIRAAEAYINMNYFEFRECFGKIDKRMSIGNSQSLLIA